MSHVFLSRNIEDGNARTGTHGLHDGARHHGPQGAAAGGALGRRRRHAPGGDRRRQPARCGSGSGAGSAPAAPACRHSASAQRGGSWQLSNTPPRARACSHGAAVMDLVLAAAACVPRHSLAAVCPPDSSICLITRPRPCPPRDQRGLQRRGARQQPAHGPGRREGQRLRRRGGSRPPHRGLRGAHRHHAGAPHCPPTPTTHTPRRCVPFSAWSEVGGPGGVGGGGGLRGWHSRWLTHAGFF
jgi:hypothetical protein